MIKLSVIIPIYNTPAQLLEQCLASVQENLGAIDDEVEVLLLDDGSIEPHINPMLKAVAVADSRFKCVFKANSGVSNTRNSGIEMAKGEYITFIDADDYFEPGGLRHMLSVIQEENVAMAMFGFCRDNMVVDYKKVKKEVLVNEAVLETLFSNDMRRWYEQGTNLASVWAKIYKREVLLQNKLMFIQDIAPNEDGFFNLRLLECIPRFYMDNTLVYHYVTNTESAVHVFSNHDIRVARNILPRLEKEAKDHSWRFSSSISRRTLQLVMDAKELYFTHPKNTKSFKELKAELNDFLSIPIVRKYIRKIRLTGAKKKYDLKNILLLKLHLYWLFLITERRAKRRKE